MIDIIKVEFFRLRKSKLFWVMLALTVASPLISAFLSIFITSFVITDASQLLNVLRANDFTFTLIEDMVALLGDSSVWALFATGIVLSKEFVDGTMRNVLLANKSRAELYFGYLITSIIVAVSYLTVYFLVVLAIVAPIFGFGSVTAGTATTACLCSFALGIIATVLVQSCMCMFMFGVRKQWATVVLPLIVCAFAPTVFTTIVQIISAAMLAKGQMFSQEALRWIPFANLDLYNPASIDGAVVGMHILYSAILIAVFVTSGYYTFKRADLK